MAEAFRSIARRPVVQHVIRTPPLSSPALSCLPHCSAHLHSLLSASLLLSPHPYTFRLPFLTTERSLPSIWDDIHDREAMER